MQLRFNSFQQLFLYLHPDGDCPHLGAAPLVATLTTYFIVMSKGNMLLGHARGKVGSLVFSRANGKQIVRAKADVVANPQTEAQVIQRIMLNTVAQAYSKMASICDHSFQGVQKGAKSMSYFMKVNLNKLRQVNVSIDVPSLKAGDEVFLPGARPDALADRNGNDDVKKAGASEPGKGKVAGKDIRTKRGDGAYHWPLMGRINSPFGWRQHPITKRRDFHTGIDIKADRDAIIRGAGAGQVAYSGWMGGYGKVIVINHQNGQSTLYAHCSSLLVGQGVNVKRGDNIARVGTTGRSTGPHLHFEVRSGNSPVNPLRYLK